LEKMMMSLYMEIVIKNQVMIPEVMEIYGNELILFLMIPEVMRIYGNELILFLIGDTSTARSQGGANAGTSHIAGGC
jgi:hypothetical protein